MAQPDQAGASFGELDGAGLRVGVVCARWNREIVDRLLDGVTRGLRRGGVDDADVRLEWVPGSFELPLAAQTMAQRDDIDAVIVLGAVIRGETFHFEIVAGEAARGVQEAQLTTGVPIAFGALTTEDRDQALARSEGAGGHNVGEECAAVAIEMARLVERLRV